VHTHNHKQWDILYYGHDESHEVVPIISAKVDNDTNQFINNFFRISFHPRAKSGYFTEIKKNGS